MQSQCYTSQTVIVSYLLQCQSRTFTRVDWPLELFSWPEHNVQGAIFTLTWVLASHFKVLQQSIVYDKLGTDKWAILYTNRSCLK